MSPGDPSSAAPLCPPPAAQRDSAGGSSNAIHEAVLAAAEPVPGLRWVDVGCGTGDILRSVRDEHAPADLVGVDIIDWLEPGLRDAVTMVTGPAEEVMPGLEPADRVILAEVLEHLEAPFTVLRAAARLVAPGGILVASTPNVTTLRHRLELLTRGQLTSFRPDNLPHVAPMLPHVVERVLEEEGLRVTRGYAGGDVIPLTGGRPWPARFGRWAPNLVSVSSVFVGRRPA